MRTLQFILVVGVLFFASICFADPATQPADIPLPTIPDKTFNVMDYGAVGDGASDDTAHLQAAINACAAAKGGTVLLPAGSSFDSNFLTVTSDNTAIKIDGTLLCEVKAKYADVKKSLITFQKVHDVELCGSGTIEGRGGLGGDACWWGNRAKGIEAPAASDRPRLVRFADCDTVSIHDITLKNSPSFHIIFGNTNNVTINHVTVYAPSSEPTQLKPGEMASHNSDGIDPHGSNYLIENCNISDGDDDIVVVATNPISRNITIRDCTIGTGHGVSLSGGGLSKNAQAPKEDLGVDGVLVTDCTFDGTTNGIRCKANRTAGATIQNVTFQNLKMEGVRLPIFITDWYASAQGGLPADPATDTEDGDAKPVWKNITFRNVTASGGPSVGVVGCIYGLPDSPVDGLHFQNVKINAHHGLVVDHIRNFTIDNDCRFDALEGNTLISSSNLKTPPAPYDVEILPDGFSLQEIGSPKVPENTMRSLYDPNIQILTFECEGVGCNATSDQFSYCSKPAAGVTAIQAELTRLELSHAAPGFDPPESQAGLMYRATNDVDSAYVGIFQTSSGQIVFQSRALHGVIPLVCAATVTVSPGEAQLKLTRSPDGIAGFYSTDSGATWTQLGSTTSIDGLDAPAATVGVVAANSVDGDIAPTAFAHVQTTP